MVFLMMVDKQLAFDLAIKLFRLSICGIPVFRLTPTCNKINSLPTATQPGFEKNN